MLAALRRNLSRPVLIRRLEKGDRCVVPSHKQQAEGPGTAVAGNGGGRLLQIDLFKRTVLLHQILNILELLCVHPGICDKQDALVNVAGILKRLSHIFFYRVGKSAHLHAANRHPALFQHKDWVSARTGTSYGCC